MKFFKNHAVAMLITILAMAGCVAFGFFNKPVQAAPSLSAEEYAKANYTAYLDWISDEAGILSNDTKKSIATYNAMLEHTYGSIVAVATVDGLGGESIDDYAYQMAMDAKLSGRDMILLLDKQSDNWYLQPGNQIESYLDNDLQTIFTSQFSGGSVTGRANQSLPTLFAQMTQWFEGAISKQGESSDGFGVLATLLFIMLIFIMLFGSMGLGRRRYGFGFWGPFWGPIFYPHRFPGGPHRPHHHNGPNNHRNDWFGGGGGFGGGGSGGGGGFGGGGFGGGGRGGGFGGGGGGFGGGGFGGGGRGGGFGG